MPADEPDDQPETFSKRFGISSGELRERALSGLVIALLALVMVYWSPKAFAVLTFLVAAAMSWEWGRIVRGPTPDIGTLVHILAVLIAAVLTASGMAGLGVAAAIIGAIAVSALVFGSGRSQLSGAGVLYTALPVIALGWLRGDEPLGFDAVLFVLLTVAVTDIAAYLSGRSIGGPKLWPQVSPNKTWSGLCGALACKPRVHYGTSGTGRRFGGVGLEAAFQFEGRKRSDPGSRWLHGSNGWHRHGEHRCGFDRLRDRRLCARSRSSLRILMLWR
jgi:phosphatidate cytidylyltransferase